jgi:hypothetical protein
LTSAPTYIRAALLAAVVAFLGLLVGALSSLVPVLIIFGVIGGIALFVLIYDNLFIGVWLFLVFNLVLPQAGPGLDLGIQVAIVGETRGLHFNVHEIVMIITLAAVLLKVILMLLKKDWDELAKLFRSPVTIGVVLYVLTSILACFVGMIHDADGLVIVFRFVRTVFFAYIFFLVIYIVRTRKQFQILLVTMVVCFTLVAGFGLVQKAMGETWSNEFAQKVLKKLGYPDDVNYVAGESDVQAYRINSTFLHPNILGGYLVFALPFLVSLLSLTWRRKRYWLWAMLLFVALPVNLVALFLTGSRAAWVAAGVIALIYGIFGFFDRRVWLVAVTLIMVFALIIVMFNPPEFVEKRFSSLSAKEAAEARLYQYSYAIDYFMKNPIFGIGMGMEGQRIIENNIRQTWAAVENLYLTYLVSHGLVGLTAFLLVFILFWGVLLKARHRSRGDPFIYFNAEALILGVVGLAVANLFGAWLLFAIPMVTLFWFFIGMGASLYNIYRDEAAEAREEPLPRLPILPRPRLNGVSE